MAKSRKVKDPFASREATKYDDPIPSREFILNHLEQANEQITRTPLPLPTLCLNPEIKDIDSFGFDSIEIRDYEHHPHISAPISV